MYKKYTSGLLPKFFTGSKWFITLRVTFVRNARMRNLWYPAKLFGSSPLGTRSTPLGCSPNFLAFLFICNGVSLLEEICRIFLLIANSWLLFVDSFVLPLISLPLHDKINRIYSVYYGGIVCNTIEWETYVAESLCHRFFGALCTCAARNRIIL